MLVASAGVRGEVRLHFGFPNLVRDRQPAILDLVTFLS